MPTPLPPGYTSRATSRGDLDALAALAAAADIADLGEVEYTADDIRGFWDLPGVEMARDCHVVFAGSGPHAAVVAMIDLWPRVPDELEGGFVIHPDHRWLGLEEWLVDWGISRAGQAASEVGGPVGLAVWTVAGESGDAALAAAGFAVERHFSRMSIDVEEQPPAIDETLDGLDVRAFRPDEHGLALHAAHEEAFADHFRHHVFTYEEWSEKRFTRAAFDPSLWLVAWDGDEVAAYVLCEVPDGTNAGWVSTVGVRPAWRGRGLAKGLLLRAFAEFHRRGIRRVSLGVDAENATGATALYAAVGMHVSATYLFHRRTVDLPAAT